MANLPLPFVSNPYSSFDPSQFQNPYSLYNGQALPWPSQYAGTPTDAQGNPIQSFVQAQQAAQQAAPAPAPAAPAAPAPAPGMTLNSSPLGPGGTESLAQMWNASGVGQPMNTYPNQYGYAGPDLAAIGGAAPMAVGAPSSFNGGGGNVIGGGNVNYYGGGGAAPAQPQAAAPAAPAAPAFDSYNAALSALANPGKVTTPGATVPQSLTQYQPSSGVLQNFLANWKPQGGTGPGSQFTQSFYNTLKGKG